MELSCSFMKLVLLVSPERGQEICLTYISGVWYRTWHIVGPLYTFAGRMNEWMNIFKRIMNLGLNLCLPSCCCSVVKLCLTLKCHGLQHARLSCPSLSPGVCSDSRPLSKWCYLIISFSATLFFFCLESFPGSGTFPMNQLFASDNQNTGVSTSASVLPMNIQDWFPLELTGLISLLSKGLSSIFSSTTILFFLIVVDFVIHWNETAMGLHVFPILIPPPTSLSTWSF